MELSPGIIYGAIAAAANIVGGLWISTKPLINKELLKYLIAIGAGFMLAAVFLEILPATIRLENITSEKVMLLVLIGYLAIQFFEHTLAAHFHFGEETHCHLLSKRTAYTAIGGLAIHTFFDGVSIASGFAINFKLGLIIFIAILLHKLPEGFTVASIIIASGHSRHAARIATIFVGSATLLGAISLLLIKSAVHYALPLSAGVTLYVAASDLIPEVNGEEKKISISLAVFGGVALYYITEKMMEFIHPALFIIR